MAWSAKPAAVRLGTAADIEPCLELWAETVRARDGAEVDPSQLHIQLERARLKFLGAVNAFLVTEDELGLTGFALAVPHEPADDGTHLALIGTRPRAQGRGVGRALLQELTRFRRESGDRALDLRVLTGNSGARRLYQKLGWLEVGKPEPHEVTGKLFQRYELRF
ncbi:GNAT family N-acetyltransferase [Psychromicrobium silvestre]|nr:GNAT family N-acetyltransferase [Psychromicrobium silvestre]